MMWCCCNPVTICDLVGFADDLPPDPTNPSSEWPTDAHIEFNVTRNVVGQVHSFSRCIYMQNFETVGAWVQLSCIMQFNSPFANMSISLGSAGANTFRAILDFARNESLEQRLRVITNTTSRYDNQVNVSSPSVSPKTMTLRMTRTAADQITITVVSPSADSYLITSPQMPSVLPISDSTNDGGMQYIGGSTQVPADTEYVDSMSLTTSWD